MAEDAPEPGLSPPRPAAVTGLILAGGEGRRMGGRDKGLLPLDGRALVEHVHARFAPQVARVLISANRHASDYARWGQVVPDDAALAGYQGPLAGVAAGLGHAPTPWLATVACDMPRLPGDLVARLAAALADGGRLAVARAGGRRQAVCMLLATSLQDDLRAWLAAGERKVQAWQDSVGAVEVVFDDAAGFDNVNSTEDLDAQRRDRDAPHRR